MSNVTMTQTDETFIEYNPGYYIFSDREFTGNCNYCGKPYKTHLEMNKFCSRACMEDWLEAAMTKATRHGI